MATSHIDTDDLKKLATIMGSSENPIIIMNHDYDVEWVNESFTSLTGYSLEDITCAKPVSYIECVENNFPIIHRIRKKLEMREMETEEITNYNKSGKRFWVKLKLTPIYNDSREIEKFVCFMSDITDQKEFEANIIFLAREMANFIQHANTPIIGIDRNGYINEWNKMATQIIGLNKADVYGTKIQKLISTNSMSDFNNLLKDVFSQQPVKNSSITFNGLKQNHRMLLLSAIARKNQEGKISGALLIGQDITELTEYQEKLELMVERRTLELDLALREERELVALKSKFISIASHEFRTPLSTIALATGFIKKYKDVIKPDKLNEKLGSIEKEISHMTYLLDDVLLLGKADAGKIEVNVAPVKVGFFKKLVKEVMKSSKTHHKLIYHQKLISSTIMTSENLMRNIIINLVTNAVKFSPEAKEVIVNITSDKNDLFIQVKDAGIGIPAAEIDGIFNSFSRGSNATTIDGTGLGLPIAKKAVELLHGKITVASELGKGTQFNVTLPLLHG